MIPAVRIRESQLQVLRDAAYVDVCEAALLRFFPDYCEELTPADLRRLVVESSDRARSFGLTMASYQGFASFELIFGERFWERDEFAWAKHLLEDREIADAVERYRRLREGMVFFLADQAEREQEAERAAENTITEEADS
jgi:hypothetical protein